MGQFQNALNQAAADAAAKKQEMNMLLKGKTPDQQAIIKFFYGAGGGCTGKSMTVQQYQEKVRARL